MGQGALAFSRAIALGMDEYSVVQAVLQMPVIAGCLHRVAAAWPRPLTAAELFGRAGAAGIAAQALLILLVELVGSGSRGWSISWRDCGL